MKCIASRILINNRAGISDLMALKIVSEVVLMGRVSVNNTQYCFHSEFGGGLHVHARRTPEGSDVFDLWVVRQEESEDLGEGDDD